MKFRWSSRELVTNRNRAHHPLNLSIIRWSLTRNRAEEHQILCEAANLNRRPVGEKGVCSAFNQTAQRLQISVRKNLETMSGMNLNRLQTKLQPNRPQMNAMVLIHLETCIDWTNFDFRFEFFFSNLLLKMTIYCVTDQPYIT